VICAVVKLKGENIRMRCEIVRAGPSQRALLRQLFELYAHEFSAWNVEEVDGEGRFTPDDFLVDGWGRRGGVGRYLLRVDGQWAGFAFVERGSYVAPGKAMNWLMDEFFILMRYRRLGLGRRFALGLFERLPGVWEMGQIPQNRDATAFWREVLAGVGGGGYEEFLVENDAWHGPVQVVRVEGIRPAVGVLN
jgi:predicted acetyltransferase